jgi:hypothetical protein
MGLSGGITVPTEPERGRPIRSRPPAKPNDDGFVFFDVDGFAQLTPEQRTWPIVETGIPVPKLDDVPDDSDSPAS